MFYDTEGYILQSDMVQGKKIMVDFQPFEKTIQFEENIEIELTARMFCDKYPEIQDTSYVQIGDALFKIMHRKEWSDYLECWLYLCERGSHEAD